LAAGDSPSWENTTACCASEWCSRCGWCRACVLRRSCVERPPAHPSANCIAHIAVGVTQHTPNLKHAARSPPLPGRCTMTACAPAAATASAADASVGHETALCAARTSSRCSRMLRRRVGVGKVVMCWWMDTPAGQEGCSATSNLALHATLIGVSMVACGR
jgi:hypothetical protein